MIWGCFLSLCYCYYTAFGAESSCVLLKQLLSSCFCRRILLQSWDKVMLLGMCEEMGQCWEGTPGLWLCLGAVRREQGLKAPCIWVWLQECGLKVDFVWSDNAPPHRRSIGMAQGELLDFLEDPCPRWSDFPCDACPICYANSSRDLWRTWLEETFCCVQVCHCFLSLSSKHCMPSWGCC